MLSPRSKHRPMNITSHIGRHLLTTLQLAICSLACGILAVDLITHHAGGTLTQWELFRTVAYGADPTAKELSHVTPHPVPDEFASSQYVVKVNGQPVPVFHAGLNVYFASFDFANTVAVKVTAGRVKGSKSIGGQYLGQVYYEYRDSLEAANFWQNKAQVRPLSKNVRCQTNGGADVTFSLTEAGQYTVERPGTSNYGDQVLFSCLLTGRRPTARKLTIPMSFIWGQEYTTEMSTWKAVRHYTLRLSSLFGAINIWDARDVRILGRGTVLYYGPQSEDKAPIGYGVQKKVGSDLKYWYPMNTRNVETTDS